MAEHIYITNVKLGKNLTGIKLTERFSATPTSNPIFDFTNAKDLVEIGEETCYNSGNSGARSVELPASLKKIKTLAFHHSIWLRTISVPDNVTELGDGAFYYCNSLQNIKIPSTILEVPSNCFNHTSVYASQVMHDNIRSIGAYAFADTILIGNLTVVMPRKLESIGANAFEANAGTNFKITYDFTRCEQVPTIESNSLNSIDKIIVSPAMYGAFGTAPVWSDIANYLVIGGEDGD